MSQRTLVLNATYEPLAVVPLRRAVLLVLAEKAEVLDSVGEVHSANASLPLPKVIRLKYFVRVPYRRRVPVTRRAVLQRDNNTCVYCGGVATTMDHVRPKALGGKHTWQNIVAACRKCNGKKGHRTLDELGWKLPFKPFEPAGVTAFCVVIGSVEEEWEPYLAG